MAKDREGVTVHTMNPVHRRGPVFYASLPRDTETPKGHGTNGEEAKHRLVSILWDHLVAMDSPLWTFRLSSNRAAFPIQVVRDPLGKPHLLLGAHRGPAISFSEGGGKVWAALCGDESDMGIDVAEAVEFQGEYPFHRVFHAQELQHVLNLAGGDLDEGISLALVCQGSRCQGPRMRLPLCGSAANPRRSIDRVGRRVCLSRALIREGSGAFSNRRRPVSMGAFVSSGEDVAFHRRFELPHRYSHGGKYASRVPLLGSHTKNASLAAPP